MLQAILTNLHHDIAIIQYYISRRQKAGFFDMEKLIEVLAIKLFRVSHGLDLENLNIRYVNFPAIDLKDEGKKTAIQVTTNATSAKIRRTIEKFKKHKLDQIYSKLIIFGFCKADKSISEPGVEVLNIDNLIGMIMMAKSERDIKEIVEAVRMHIDYSRLHPYDDNSCLSILLNTIDRNAIKHRMQVEGNYADMVSGLNEITELISKGQIAGREKSKSMDQFTTTEIIEFMRDTRNRISDILIIMNGRRRPGTDFLCLNYQDETTIDEIKKSIVDDANSIASKQGLSFHMSMRG